MSYRVDEQAVKEILLDRISFAYRTRISTLAAERAVDVSVLLDPMADAFVVGLYSFQPGERDEVVNISYPKTWWDAFKQRWFPRWLLKKYPANISCHRIERGCTYPTLHVSNREHFPVAFIQAVKLDASYPCGPEE